MVKIQYAEGKMLKIVWFKVALYGLTFGILPLPSPILKAYSTVAPLPGSTALSQDQLIKDVELYLRSLSTLTADLRQENPDQTVFYGKLFLSHAGGGTYGKLRLDYQPPSKDLIIVDGRDLVHYDTTTNEANTYSISMTPASFLLKRNIQLRNDFTLKTAQIEDTKARLTFVKKDDEEGMALSLVFQLKPFLLLQEWIIDDAQGKKTHVFLSNLKIGTTLSESLFVIH